MAFVSKSKSGKSNLPDNQLVIKVPTSKGYVTLGKLGLYNESALHSKVAQLTNEQLIKLLSNAEVSIQSYSNGNVDDEIELVL
mgnify:CR=1 FL=1